MDKPVLQVPVVAGVVIRKDDKYLLVQEKSLKAYGLWNFPAGRVEIGDSIEQTAIKEAREESGYEVTLIKKLGIFQHEATEPPKHAFTAKIIGGDLKYPEDEILDARWFSFEEIKAMESSLRGEWITGAITLAEKEDK